MSNWDDEDFEVTVGHTDEFGDEGGELLDDWEAAANSDEEQQKPKARPVPTLSAAQRAELRKQKEREERERKAMSKTLEASKKDQLEREIQSDLLNATDLLSVADEHPRSRASVAGSESVSAGPTKLSDLAIFKVEGLKDYTELRKTLVPIINDLAAKNKAMQHSGFVVEMCRDLCKPLTSDQVQKVISTLNAIANEKHREERARRLGGKPKPMVKVQSAKSEKKIDILDDDGLGDDDFM